MVINIAASPFSYNQGQIRQQIISQKAAKNEIPFFYVNQIGANTELVFDGSSLAVNNRGEIIKQLNSFDEDIQYCELDEMSSDKAISTNPKEKIELIHDALVLGVKDYFNKMGFKKATLVYQEVLIQQLLLL